MEGSLLIFDTNSLEISNLIELGNKILTLQEKRIRILIFINESDNLFHSAASRLTNDNYFRIENRLSRTVMKAVNDRLSRIGLIQSDPSKTLLDNCYSYFEQYNQKTHIPPKQITEKELSLLIILAAEYKTYSVILNLFNMSRKELENFVTKMSPFIEIQDISRIEIHQHSGYKIASNSSSWLFKILGEYQLATGDEKVAGIILEIVSRLKGKPKFESIYKKIISFDNLNQSFHNKGGGSVNLIYNVYRKLESLLYNDGHFWLQRAKSILHLKRDHVLELEVAIDYAKKSYYDADHDKLQINATTTLALLCGRAAYLQKFADIEVVTNAIEWYYAALQENQYNKRYIDEIIDIQRKNNDLRELCSWILGNSSKLDVKAKPHAEFIVNKVKGKPHP